MKIFITEHAAEKLVERNIPEKLVTETVFHPDLTVPTYQNRVAYFKNMGRNYLKVVVAKEKGQFIVVTAHWVDKSRLDGLK